METKNIAEPALILDIRETVSKTISKMLKNKKEEALVLDGGKPSGVVFARNLVKRKVDKPEQSNIGKFIEHMKPIPLNTSQKKIIESIMKNDYNALPLREGNNFFFVTKLGMLNAVKNGQELKGKKAVDIMNSPQCISADDSIATAISVLKETGVSRLPVLNKNGRADGMVDSLALLKTYVERSRMSLGEGAGEKTRLASLQIAGIMKKDFPRVGASMPLKQVIGIMFEKGMPTAIVEDGGRPVGIITPKPILRLFIGKTKTAYVRVNGMQDESDFIKTVVDEEIGNEVRKIGGFVPIKYLVMNIDKYHKTGRRKKYSVKVRMIAQKTSFYADAHAWDITKAVKEVLAKLEKEVMKYKEKKSVYRRAP